MSQFPHDEFVKEYLPELIQDYGEARSAENVNAQRREIDVFFQPTKEIPTTANTLGLLGKLVQTTVLFEVFRNPVESYEITECLGKLFDVQDFLAKGLKTGIVVIHQLPVNESTLWLRILGKGKVQENAIDELKALPKEYTHRDNVLYQFTKYLLHIKLLI